MDDVDGVRARSWADRPSPAIPLFLLALVVTGALVVTLALRAAVVVVPTDDPAFSLVAPPSSGGWVRLIYWILASVVAYLLAIWIARRQGYRSGVWVDRRPLVVAGLAALLVAVIVVIWWLKPNDTVFQGNVPLLAIAVGLVVWATWERRPGLWVVVAVIVSLALLANLYDMANVFTRLGVPAFEGIDEVANLGTVALALFVAASVFALLHRRDAQAQAARGARALADGDAQ